MEKTKEEKCDITRCDCMNIIKLLLDDVEEKRRKLSELEVHEKLNVLKAQLIDSLAELTAKPDDVNKKKKSIKRKLLRLRSKTFAGCLFHL